MQVFLLNFMCKCSKACVSFPKIAYTTRSVLQKTGTFEYAEAVIKILNMGLMQHQHQHKQRNIAHGFETF